MCVCVDSLDRCAQVMMFSATLSDEIKPVCKKFMTNPLEIYIREGEKVRDWASVSPCRACRALLDGRSCLFLSRGTPTLL